jgi:hypothetical protein
MQDRTIRTYQCKRHKEFGAAKVEAAVKAHVRHADKKVLLLTRIASPQARDAIAVHPDWELWDKEDVAKRIRQLSKSEQIRLVDIFFPGSDSRCFGEVEAGPWMSVEDFFSAFLRKGAPSTTCGNWWDGARSSQTYSTASATRIDSSPC